VPRALRVGLGGRLGSGHRGGTTESAPAYLLRTQAIHHYVPLYDFIPGTDNIMSDKASGAPELSDAQLLSHFDFHFPQIKPWRLVGRGVGTDR
jgi:hypothetical protein